MQKVNIETFLKNKKKQKENREEIDIETWHKIKRTSEKSIKENTKQQKNKILIFLYSIKMSEKTLKIVDFEVK